MGLAMAVQLTEAGSDEVRLDELTSQLRLELLDLDVDDVSRVRVGDAPPGTRAVDFVAAGALLVTMKEASDLVANVVNTIREWIRRDPVTPRSVIVAIGDQRIELTGASSEQQDRLIAEFVRAVGSGEGSGR